MFNFVRYASRVLHINTVIIQIATLFGRMLGARYMISVEKIMETNGVHLARGEEYSQNETGNIENKKNNLTKRVHTWCTESLGGTWACLSEGDIQIRQLRLKSFLVAEMSRVSGNNVVGGLTNYLYICSLPSHIKPNRGEPDTVVLRIYGHIATSSMHYVVRDSVVFAIFSEKKIGPKLYGLFQEGRVEEYIPTKCLSRVDIVRNDISIQIAHQLAFFHTLEMPLCKRPKWLRDIISGWLEEAQNNVLDGPTVSTSEGQMVQKIKAFKLATEMEKLFSILSSVKSPVVFSHNDLQEGNILYMKDCPEKSRRMTLIDWEYCSYNYRGFDFGNHFIEWIYDYTNPAPPYFSEFKDCYPSVKEQCDFFRAYMKVTSDKEPTEATLSDMYVEANTYALASHFLWGVWAVVQYSTSDIPFDYLAYAMSRLEGYFRMKSNLPNLRDDFLASL